MKKKLLSVLLSTAMVASLLVGCGSSSEEAESITKSVIPLLNERLGWLGLGNITEIIVVERIIKSVVRYHSLLF